MRQAGRYLPEYRAMREKMGSFWRMCMTPEVAAEITLQPMRRFGFDAAIIFSDIMLVPYALGTEVVFEEGVGPTLTPIDNPESLSGDTDEWAERLAPTYQAMRIVRAELSREKALLGFAGAPWTLATYMAQGRGSPDQRKARAWANDDPGSFAELVNRIVDCVAFHLIGQFDAGADAVQIFDSWASGLPPEQFQKWVVEPTTRIVEKVRAAHQDAKIIGFPRGTSAESYERYADATGVDAVSLDTAVPIDWAVRVLAPKVALQGNLDPRTLVAGGAALTDGVDKILRATRDVPFIFNLGHGVVPETPPVHVNELVARVRAE